MATILVVDDDAHTVRIMSMWLTRHGHDVIEARNGQIALETLRGNPVDIVISDMNMPLLDGLGLLTAAREQLALGMPFLILSSRCDQAELARKIEPLGGRVYPKPFVPSRLVADVERVLTVGVSWGSSP